MCAILKYSRYVWRDIKWHTEIDRLTVRLICTKKINKIFISAKKKTCQNQKIQMQSEKKNPIYKINCADHARERRQ